MAAVSPWFAMTRMLIEIRSQRARMDSSRPSGSEAGGENSRTPADPRTPAVR